MIQPAIRLANGQASSRGQTDWRRATASRHRRPAATILLIGAVLALAPLSQARAGACDDPTDPSPHPRQIPGCQVQAQPTIKFNTLQHQYWQFTCTGANAQFLGNDEGYFSSGFDLNNNCFSTWTWAPQFDNEFSVTLFNWCDKPEPLIVSIGCMPGN